MKKSIVFNFEIYNKNIFNINFCKNVLNKFLFKKVLIYNQIFD